MTDTGRGRSALGWLECSGCHAVFDVDRPRGVCESCGAVLLARYRIEEAAKTLSPETLRWRPADQWRYAELLPGSEAPITLGEGMTPLLHAAFLGAACGLERLYIKDESQNPTASFKARGMSTAMTMARKFGLRRVALPSAGNAGGAAAAYGALAGLGVDVFFPADTPAPFRLEAVVHGARVHRVDGDIAVCGAKMRQAADREAWFDVSTLREPYRLEGKKTMGYELAEQLGWELPDWIFYPAGGGTGLIGMWKAFDELAQLGWLRSERRPRMVAVQAEGCAPIVRAWEAGAAEAAPWLEPRTYASGLCVPSPIGDRLMLRVLRESNGTAIAVGDEEMAAAQLDIARGEGVFAAPEGAATWVAARRLAEAGVLRPEDCVVLFNTGSGLKYPKIPGLSVP